MNAQRIEGRLNLPMRVARYAYRNKLQVVRYTSGQYAIINPTTKKVEDWTAKYGRNSELDALRMCRRYLTHGPRCTVREGFRKLIHQLLKS